MAKCKALTGLAVKGLKASLCRLRRYSQAVRDDSIDSPFHTAGWRTRSADRVSPCHQSHCALGSFQDVEATPSQLDRCTTRCCTVAAAAAGAVLAVTSCTWDEDETGRVTQKQADCSADTV